MSDLKCTSGGGGGTQHFCGIYICAAAKTPISHHPGPFFRPPFAACFSSLDPILRKNTQVWLQLQKFIQKLENFQLKSYFWSKFGKVSAQNALCGRNLSSLDPKKNQFQRSIFGTKSVPKTPSWYADPF